MVTQPVAVIKEKHLIFSKRKEKKRKEKDKTLYLTAIEMEKLNYRFNSYCPLIFAYQYGN